MPDDLDQQLRAAMKTLDEQVPSGYFEALPNQTLARLEGSMQHGSSGTDTREARDQVAPPPLTASQPSSAPEAHTTPVAKPIMDQDREEDSGLHDIRNLAQSTKQRLSSRRITSPPVSDDVLASSSGSFKNIALPQPARMVSLPSVDELPSKAEVAAAEKAAKESAKRSAKDSQKLAKAEAAVAPLEAKVAAPVVPARQAFSLPSQQRKSSKGPLLAIVGLGVAAAAGGVIFLQVNKSNDEAAPSAASESSVKAADMAPAAGSAASTVTAQPIAVPEPAPAQVEAPKEEAAAVAAPAEAQIAADNVKDAEDKADSKKKPSKSAKGSSKTKADKVVPTKVEVKTPDKVEVKKPVATKGGEAEGEPSFDALLKEAGVNEKKEAKPKLDKKSLTGDDFKKGMSAVEGKAKGCYKGTQGTALVKLTVAPSGQISKVSVAGDFAGKPEAACVQSALKSASFPPWDGGPQSFTYAVLLSD